MPKEEQLGYPCNNGKKEEKIPTVVYVIVVKFPAVPQGNELRGQRGHWWSQGPNVGTEE